MHKLKNPPLKKITLKQQKVKTSNGSQLYSSNFFNEILNKIKPIVIIPKDKIVININLPHP